MLTSISKGSECNNCTHKGVCRFVESMTEVREKLDEIRTSYTTQPFELEANCRHFTTEVSHIK